MTARDANEAVANARAVHTYEPGYCQRFTREAWEVGSLYGSAIDAWNGSRQKHPDDRHPPKGAPCYYAGGNYGHAVVFVSESAQDIRSTDCTSTGDVSDADLSWPEVHWGYRYLGWTGDINGVDLPLDDGAGGEDMPLTDEDLSAIAKRVNQVLGDFNAQGEPRTNDDPEQANKRLAEIETIVRRLETKINAL